LVRKLLIANRGEIARRIIRTCKKLGIATVAVYSDADMKALHRLEADESVHIGPSPVAQSYLQIERIVEAAKTTGADAVHPGYGLLSENALFASACREAGLLFIGPKEVAIEQMGSKTKARSIMQRAGVPIVPGSDGAVDSVDRALQVAREIGYPVMMKAAHGGGGIGMQVVSSDEEMQKAFASNQARAKAYFGNGEMFIEKYIRDPRHIEIQVLFDAHGNGVHLFERECSVQRRHQKVVEEALSPFVDDELRMRMGHAALAAAAAIGYENAGTVEFLVDSDRNFYFLEMNTRLQVEHPVTECITGLDLVEWQIRIACGEQLPFEQKDIQPSGHAIECRIYAEDPDKLLPSPGTITAFELPAGPGIRNDVGVEAGTEVTPFYDPMIGKLIAHGQDRAEAIARMRQAIDAYRVEGIKTNLPLLRQILSADAFERGDTTTSFISELKRQT
jgi:acetyl-CoA carboxylase, biotin carboxylase subunit